MTPRITAIARLAHAIRAIPGEEAARAASAVRETDQGILEILRQADGPVMRAELMERMSAVTRNQVHHGLNRLRRQRAVTSLKAGRTVAYRINQ